VLPVWVDTTTHFSSSLLLSAYILLLIPCNSAVFCWIFIANYNSEGPYCIIHICKGCTNSGPQAAGGLRQGSVWPLEDLRMLPLFAACKELLTFIWTQE